MNEALPRLAPRAADSHKGDFGRALLIGGSRGMTGAIALAGMAALRGGAGLVKLAVSEACVDTVASFEPSYMTVPLPCDGDGRISGAAKVRLEAAAEEATCVACGPGLGQSDELFALVEWLYTTLDKPLVIDADGLNLLAKRSDPLAGAGGPRILTPHPGEFRRLIGGEKLGQDEARERAVQLADQHGVVLVLKGHRTLITDGRTQHRNATGNPGMATGGTGDVLIGLITAILGQGLPPLDAARLAVHIHGRAGDLAAETLGQVGMIARDLVTHLPQALREVS
ncbi:MAG: NAD(P)H-hydrate dehydratase [Planctomycetes bacterium]|nr:NAD(P)H-hydrate dehydratase [Planctomycetota bacterium]